MIKVNGTLIPTPSDYKVSLQDIDNGSARAASGLMVRTRIAVKRKFEMTWNYLSKSDLAALLGKIADTSFEVEYVDPETGGVRTGEFYVGDRTVSAIDYISGVIRWKDISFSFVEN
jgi:hypothetical protein